MTAQTILPAALTRGNKKDACCWTKRAGTILLSILFSLVFAKSVFSEPLIGLTQGSFKEDTSVTIQGSSFGTKDPATPVMLDDFEDGIDPAWGYKYSKETAIAVGALGTTNDYQYLRHGFSSEAFEGHFYNDTGNSSYDNYFLAISLNHPARSEKWFARIWFRPHWVWHQDGDYSMSKIKVARWAEDWASGSKPNHYTELNYSYARWINEFPTKSTHLGAINPVNDITMDEWHYFDFQTSSNNPANTDTGTAKYWLDGRLVCDLSGLRTSSTDTQTRADDLGFYNCRHRGQHPDDMVWFDELYLDNTWARVMIGDADTLDACRHTEMQIPTAWSNNSITITVKQGSFSYGDAYLYVFDENGDANPNGHRITFEKSEGWMGGMIDRWQAEQVSRDDLNRAVYWYMKSVLPVGDPMNELTEEDIGNALKITD